LASAGPFSFSNAAVAVTSCCAARGGIAFGFRFCFTQPGRRARHEYRPRSQIAIRLALREAIDVRPGAEVGFDPPVRNPASPDASVQDPDI
jgi:hypothetical protein